MILCMFKKAGKCDLPKNQANIDIFKHNTKSAFKTLQYGGKAKRFLYLYMGSAVDKFDESPRNFDTFLLLAFIEMPIYVKYHLNC